MPSPIILLHTDEYPDGGTMPNVALYLQRMGYESHFCYDPFYARSNYIQLLPLTVPAKSLVNLAGGVETNRRERDGNPAAIDVIQIELHAHAADVPYYPQEWYDNLREFLLWLCSITGTPYVFPLSFVRPVRALTDAEWNDPALTGIIGHCHAAENRDAHWDPGMLRTDLLALPLTPQAEDDDMGPVEYHDNGDRTRPVAVTSPEAALGWAVDAAARAEHYSQSAAATAAQILAAVSAAPAPTLSSVPTSVLLAELARRVTS